MQLSIVIPVFNTRDCLEKLVASIAIQTQGNFEAIFVNDGSRDESHDYLTACQHEFPWIRYFYREHAGLSAARNFGVAKAQGNVVTFVDSDDWIAENYVAETLRPFLTTDCFWTVRPVFLVNGTQTEVHSTNYANKSPADNPNGYIVDASSIEARLSWWPSAWNKAFRREMIAKNWFDEGMLFEDHGFNIRNYNLQSQFLYVPVPIYYQRRDRPGQITSLYGDVNHHIFRCFDVWEWNIRNSAVPDKRAYLFALTSRLFGERAHQFGAEAETTAFREVYTTWLASHDLQPDLGAPVNPDIPDPAR